MTTRNPATCAVLPVIGFLNTKYVHQVEIPKHIFQCTEKVKWTKKMWGNGVSCSERTKLWCMARAEVATCLWPWASWKKVNAKLRETGISHFLNYTCIFGLARVWGETKRQKTLCRNSCKAWQWPILTKAYQSWSHNMTSDFNLHGKWWSSSFI